MAAQAMVAIVVLVVAVASSPLLRHHKIESVVTDVWHTTLMTTNHVYVELGGQHACANREVFVYVQCGGKLGFANADVFMSSLVANEVLQLLTSLC